MSDAVRVAKIQAESAQKVATIGAQANMGRLTSEREAGTFGAHAGQMRSTQNLNNVKAAVDKLNIPYKTELAKIAKPLADAELTYSQTRNIVNAMANLVKRSGGMSPEQMGKELQKAANWAANIDYMDIAEQLSRLIDIKGKIERLPRIPGQTPAR